MCLLTQGAGDLKILLLIPKAGTSPKSEGRTAFSRSLHLRWYSKGDCQFVVSLHLIIRAGPFSPAHEDDLVFNRTQLFHNESEGS